MRTRRQTLHWMLTAAIAATFAAPAFARPDDRPRPEPITGAFALDVDGVLAAPTPSGDVRRAPLDGRGRALVGPRSVNLKFGELSAGEHVTVDIRWDNPLDRDGRSFRGDGVALITVGDRSTKVRVRAHGEIRGRADEAVMHGRWTALDGERGFELHGRFAGKLVDRDADAQPE